MPTFETILWIMLARRVGVLDRDGPRPDDNGPCPVMPSRMEPEVTSSGTRVLCDVSR